jgi:TolB-like protein/DNA-binding SARP family transcriptional activator
MSQIRACVLGGFELRNGGGELLPLSRRKTRALLGYLVVEADRWHTRQRLIQLLWADRPEARARNSLTQALYDISRVGLDAGVELIARDPDRIRLQMEHVASDLRQFEAAIAIDPVATSELFAGELLEGLELASSEFSDWLFTRRASLLENWSKALKSQVVSALNGAGADGGISAARTLIEFDPLNEFARRCLIDLLARSGQRAEALRQYQICVEVFRDELGIEPEAETTELAKRIKIDESPSVQIAPSIDQRQNLIDTLPPEERPIIAVLPFENLSDDSAATDFADGLTEDLIFQLGRFRWFAVLAYGATARLRGRQSDPQSVWDMCRATHVITGRVRRHSDQLRLSAELFVCRTGEQIWANRYDVRTDEFQQVEDDVAIAIAAAIEPSLEADEMRRALRRPQVSLSAYDLTQRGKWHSLRKTLPDIAEAQRCFETATELDPTYANAWAGLAYVKYHLAQANPTDYYRHRMADCLEVAAKAVELDPDDPRALGMLAIANSFLGNLEVAGSAFCRALEICPSYAQGYAGLAYAQGFDGDFAGALQSADRTIRLRPHDPSLCRCTASKAVAGYLTEDYELAERIALDSKRSEQEWWLSNALLIASLGQQNRLVEAKGVIAEFCSTEPAFDLIEGIRTRFPFSDPNHTDHLVEGLQRAGWPGQA